MVLDFCSKLSPVVVSRDGRVFVVFGRPVCFGILWNFPRVDTPRYCEGLLVESAPFFTALPVPEWVSELVRPEYPETVCRDCVSEDRE